VGDNHVVSGLISRVLHPIPDLGYSVLFSDIDVHGSDQFSHRVLACAQISDAQKGVGENHAVSGLKFRVLLPMLELGYSVLLSDVDIVTLQNPFDFLHRDCDVEGMSDGWDNATAYGVCRCCSVHAFDGQEWE
jgi:hypothetical protein